MEKKSKRFRYVKFETQSGTGYACVCFDWDRVAPNTIQYKAGISFCSPKDTFSKFVARVKAESRFNGSQRVKSRDKHIESKVEVAPPVTNFVTNDEFKTMLSDIFEQCGKTNSIPNWALDAFNDGKYQFGLSQSENKGHSKLGPRLAIPADLK